jgi:hypothetical protein
MWLVSLIMLSWITKIILELMAYEAMFATQAYWKSFLKLQLKKSCLNQLCMVHGKEVTSKQEGTWVEATMRRRPLHDVLMLYNINLYDACTVEVLVWIVVEWYLLSYVNSAVCYWPFFTWWYLIWYLCVSRFSFVIVSRLPRLLLDELSRSLNQGFAGLRSSRRPSRSMCDAPLSTWRGVGPENKRGLNDKGRSVGTRRQKKYKKVNLL